MTAAVRTALWCAVLLCSSAWRVRADHHSKEQPFYQRLAARGNTTATGGTTSSSSSLRDAPITVSSTGASTTQTEPETAQSQSRSQTASALIPSDASFISNVDSSLSDTATFAASSATDGDDGPLSAAGGGRGSDARVFGDTFIASITTYMRPPLTAPSIATTSSQTNSTSLSFPTFPLNTTRWNATTTKPTTTTTPTTELYTNSSSSSATATSPNTTARLVPVSVETTTTRTSSTEDACTTTTFGPGDTIISYSIIHTWTITWIGDPADYTPPFPTISTPNYCTPTEDPTGRFTVSMCDSSGKSCSLVHTTAAPTASTERSLSNWYHSDTSDQRTRETTITFVTTDKNPAVVFPSSRPPDYGGSPDPAGNVHSVALPDNGDRGAAPDYGNSAPGYQDVKTAVITTPPPTGLPIPIPITVIVKPSAVIINGHTFTDNPANPTSTVVVDSSTFVIKPTEVDGAGAKVTRPPSGVGGGGGGSGGGGGGGGGAGAAPLPTKTRTTIGGIAVGMEGSSVVTMDSTTFTVGPKPTAVVVKGQTITLGPSGIVFPSQTLLFPQQPRQDTTRVVFGAELITAIGSDRVVIKGTTITYAPGSGPGAGTTITSVVDGDTILIGPSGVVVDGKTYGGRDAAATDSDFVVVGGATISQVGSTEVVIEGVTYTLSPLAPGQTTTTTVVGGETITIGPEGVAISTWTFASPYASTTVILPTNGGGGNGNSAGAAAPSPTAPAPAIATDTSKKNGSPSSSSKGPGWELTIWITTGAGILGCLLAL